MCRLIVLFRFATIAVITLLFQTHTYAQTPLSTPPSGINYQAIARDTLGHAMNNMTNLKVIFSISDSTNILFSEIHDTVSTNRYGLFTLVIGSVKPTEFNSIDWSFGKKFLEIKIESPGQNSATFEPIQFMSVPYSLHSKTAFYSFGNWSFVGNSVDSTHFLGTKNAQPLIFKTNDTTRMLINANGNIGIGSLNPTAPLTIQNKNNTANEIEFLSNGTNTADIYANSQLNIGSNQKINFLTSGTIKVGIDNTGNVSIPGNVGIGTTNPLSKLDVAGTIKISGPNSNELNRNQTGAANLAPIAYGSVNADSTINTGASTNNFTVHLVDGTPDDYYEISITSEIYTSNNYITLVTPGDDNLRASAKGVNGKLIIKFSNLPNNGIQSPFQFIVYKP